MIANRNSDPCCMPRVVFTPNLRRHLDCPPMNVSGATVGDALDRVFAANARLKTYILDDQGRTRRHVAIYVNGTRIADAATLSDAVGDGDEIFVFQALSGG